MLREQRLTSVFQPIVRADDPDDVFAHECLLRGVNPDATLMPPGPIYQAARAADLLFPLDRAARLTAIREAAAHGLDQKGTHLFINFNPTSVYDPVFCLRSTTAAIAATELRPEQVVFEVVESDQISDVGHLVRIIDYYRSAGFKVALDDLGSGYGSLNLLVDLKPDFVKLDMRLIRGVDSDPYKAGIVGKLLEMAHHLDVATVAEGIETVGEWEWVRDNGADYVQGYLFARPASPPPRPHSPMRSVLSG
jgi:EAL domain-containing protein (putative c-di-GMP-specific phosphodiesterase class I)